MRRALLGVLGTVVKAGTFDAHQQRIGISDVHRRVVRATAELLWRYRRALHRTGLVDFELPRGEKCPTWMQLVLEELRLRKWWKVTTLSAPGGGKKFRVEWRGWMRNARRRSTWKT
ncbi:MAG: hypothetical protein WBY94_06645 [Polyangiaceae bacterium]